jgi:hypothetical protein
VIENTDLRRIFEPKWDEVTGGRRQLNKEELYDDCSSSSKNGINKSRNMKWTCLEALKEEKNDVFNLLLRK